MDRARYNPDFIDGRHAHARMHIHILPALTRLPPLIHSLSKPSDSYRGHPLHRRPGEFYLESSQ